MLNKKYIFSLLFILIISIIPRALEVFNASNYFFGSEQAIEYLVTKNIVENHQIVLTAHQGGFGGFSKTPGFNYLLIVPYILFLGDPFGGRIFMFFISVLTVLTAFVVSKKIFNLKTAVFIGFFMAISPILKDYAGSVSPPFIIPLLTVIFIHILFKIFAGNEKLIPLLVFVVGLMTGFEVATAGILISLLILTGIVCFIRKTITYRYYITSFILFLLTLLPLIIFDIQNNFSNTRGVIRIILAIGNQTSKNTSLSFTEIVSSKISVFGWNFISTFGSNLIIWLTTLIIILTCSLIFVRDKSVDKRIRHFFIYLAIIPIFTFLLILVYPDRTTHQWWYADLSVIYCFLIGIVTGYFWNKKKIKIIIFIVLIVLTFAFIKRTLSTYKTEFVYSPISYIKEERVIDYIFKDAQNKPFGINVFAIGSKKTYEYLIWWKGNKIYHYQPYTKAKGLYYNLIDPSFASVYNTHKGLEPTNEKLIKTTKLPFNYIVEKRLIK